MYPRRGPRLMPRSPPQQVATAVDKKLGLGALSGDGFGRKCSPDVVELAVRTFEAAKRRRKDGAKSSQDVARRAGICSSLL